MSMINSPTGAYAAMESRTNEDRLPQTAVTTPDDNACDKKTMLRLFIAEFLGTMILVAIGDGAICQTVISQKFASQTTLNSVVSISNTAEYAGDWFTLSLGFGLALMLGIYISGGISGGHLNPAVSVVMCLFNKLSWKRLPVYMAGQFCGAFFGALVIYMSYYQAFNGLNVWDQSTAGIFATYPRDYINVGGAFVNEMIGTAILLLGIFAVTDKYNNPSEASSSTNPLVIGFILTAIALSFGTNTGFALNPARDFSARLFTSIAGWDSDVWAYGDHYWWVPLIAPLVGGTIGGAIYHFGVTLLREKEGTSSSA